MFVWILDDHVTSKGGFTKANLEECFALQLITECAHGIRIDNKKSIDIEH